MNLFETYDDFLTHDEIELIRKKVFDLKDQWKDYTHYFSIDDMNDENNMIHRIIMEGMKEVNDRNKVIENTKKANILTDVVYLNQLSQTPIDFDGRQMMIEEFDFLYEKIKNKLSKIFNISIDKIGFFDDLTVPGFHIFEGPMNFWLNGNLRWHQDGTLLFYKPELELSKVHSFLTPIQLPNSGSWVEFQDPNKLQNKSTMVHSEVDFNHDTLKFHYELTKLHHWKGDIWHALGSDDLKENEYRITLQIHAYVDDDEIMIYF